MAQQVLNTLNVRPGGNGHGGGGVPQIVGAGVRSADTGNDPLERFVKRGYGKMPPQLVGKHQIVRIAPQRPGGEPVLRLALPLCPQILKSNFRRFNLPGLSALCRGRYVVLCATFLFMLELLAYGDPPRLKVHLIPGQAQAFPLPETGEQAQRIGSLKGVSLDGFQEQRDFRIRQGALFPCAWPLEAPPRRRDWPA